MKPLEEKVLGLIDERGPLTGQELLESIGGDGLILWRTCRLSGSLSIRRIGTRYLRLDRRLKDYARLSPSILREFLTYSVVGLASDPDPTRVKAEGILSKIEQVSRAKSELAYHIVSSLGSRLENELPIQNQVCFILAGDIVYNMAHDVPRPERSTGKLVRGSDMDLVVIVGNRVPEALVNRLDEAIFQEKYRLLITPHLREEIDYVVKNLDRFREQVRFDSFKHMVACKILHEGTLLYGSDEIFQKAKSLLREHGVVRELNTMEAKALEFRAGAEEVLLHEDIERIRDEHMYLFYPTEESEEFE
ncbi:MAG: hypothetical protein ABII06_19525 [Pseudomonadota bacterium]